VTGERRKLHNEEFSDLYCSPNFFRVIKLRRIMWAEHVACIWEGDIHTGLWWGDVRERVHLEEIDVDDRVLLKWIWNRLVGRILH